MTVNGRHDTRRWIALTGWLLVALPAFQVLARQLTRTRPIGWLPESPLTLAAWPLVGLAIIVWSALGGPSVRRRITLGVFAALFATGLGLQLQLGARLQSDGFYYYAYLRSMAFDRDVDFTNDYRMLGLGDKAHLFEPTPTGYAQSAWTIGPAFAWAPFFAVGHVTALRLAEDGRDVATDGTSFPYRQAVVIAGLFYALLGAWFILRLVERWFARGLAAAAVAVTLGGSFLLWYALAEPTMTHAPSMAAVAAFTWAWAATRDARSLKAWIGLGVLAGLATLIRWQNALFALLPATEVLIALWTAGRRGERQTVLRVAAGGVLFTIAAVVTCLPQMLAWKSIYGSYLAVSPIGPAIRWWTPQLVDVLFSSRNGLLAMSPVLYVGTVGLLGFTRRAPRAAVPMLVGFAAMIYFNSCIQDWWGSAGYGGRRFDGVLPMLAVGTAAALEALRRLVARRPAMATAAVLGAGIVWNVTFLTVTARSGTANEAVDFGEVAAQQTRLVHAWIGHPFTYPASLWFAARNGVPPGDYDLLSALRFLGDPARPYGRIDLGGIDEVFLGDGWSGPRQAAGVTWRQTTNAVLLVPLDHAARLDLQIRARVEGSSSEAPTRLLVELAGVGFESAPIGSDWQVLAIRTPVSAWRAGVNRLRLALPASTSGRAVDIDFVRVEAVAVAQDPPR